MKGKQYDSPEAIKEASDEHREIHEQMFAIPQVGPNECTKRYKAQKEKYCLHCKKPKKRKYWLFGKLICKTSTCPLREGYIHPFAPQDRGESLEAMEINRCSNAPLSEKHYHVAVDDATAKAYDEREVENMDELMKDEKWVKRYKIKD